MDQPTNKNTEEKPKKTAKKQKLPNGCVKVRYTRRSVRNGSIEVVGIGYAKMMESRGILEIINRN